MSVSRLTTPSVTITEETRPPRLRVTGPPVREDGRSLRLMYIGWPSARSHEGAGDGQLGAATGPRPQGQDKAIRVAGEGRGRRPFGGGETDGPNPCSPRATRYSSNTAAGSAGVLASRPICNRSPSADTELETIVASCGTGMIVTGKPSTSVPRADAVAGRGAVRRVTVKLEPSEG